MRHQKKIEQLKIYQQEAREGGGAQSIQKQHQLGKMTARERLDYLLDPGSFVFLHEFARSQSADFALERKGGLGDGVVTGYGEIEGRLVFVFAQDFTVMGGSAGQTHIKKICFLLEKARQVGAPVIGLNDSVGARIQEGINAFGYGLLFRENSITSGVVPQISVIMGNCSGGAVYSPALTDFIFMVENVGHMFITGPKVIKEVTGEAVTMQELGGAHVHSRVSGVVDFLAADEQACLKEVRRLIGFLPSHHREAPPRYENDDMRDRADPELDEIVPERPKESYDMQEVIRRVVDKGEFMEVKASFAPNIITGFARLDGYPIGIVANQPLKLAGVLDCDASVKAARFIRFLDAFNIPIVNLVDVPGYMPGVKEERKGIIRHGAKMLYAYSTATVPMVTCIVRKAYGGAYPAMCSKPIGADFMFAWPTAEIAIMGAEGAVEIIYARQLEQADDREGLKKRLIREYEVTYSNPYYAASKMLVDLVIPPRETRPHLIRALTILRNKEISHPRRKHGNIPL